MSQLSIGSSGDALLTQLQRWRALDIVSADQVEAILTAEARYKADRDAPANAPATRSRLPVAAELLGYIGTAIAAAAAGLLLTSFWADLETWAQLTLVAMATLLVAAGAELVSPSHDPAVVRLANFLWFVSAAGVCAFTLLFSAAQVDLDGQNVALAIGAVATPYTAWLLSRRRSTLQHLATFSAALVGLFGVVFQYDHAAGDVVGPAVWTFGAVWLLLAWGGLLPRTHVGYVLGALSTGVGAQILIIEEAGTGLWLGLFTAATLLVAGAALRSGALVAVGVPLVFVFITQTIARVLDLGGARNPSGSLAATAVILLLGLALLGGALTVARRSVPAEEGHHGA